jgi:FKBP-type peptidyl-prolyl cis-trans isomerase
VLKLGRGDVSGWDVGITGMALGGKRVIVVPPHLAYGKEGLWKVVPPDSALYFEAQVLDIK